MKQPNNLQLVIFDQQKIRTKTIIPFLNFLLSKELKKTICDSLVLGEANKKDKQIFTNSTSNKVSKQRISYFLFNCSSNFIFIFFISVSNASFSRENSFNFFKIYINITVRLHSVFIIFQQCAKN